VIPAIGVTVIVPLETAQVGCVTLSVGVAGTGLIVMLKLCGKLVVLFVLLVTVIVPEYTVAVADVGIGILKGDAVKAAKVIFVNPSVIAAAFQTIEYLSGVPVVVKSIETAVVPKQIGAIVCGMIEGRLLKLHPLLP
jgi:hypothetical protein